MYYELRSNIENLNSEYKKYELSLNDTKTNLTNLNENNLIERRNQIDSQLKSSASQAERYQQNMKRQDETIRELNPKLDRLKKEYHLLKNSLTAIEDQIGELKIKLETINSKESSWNSKKEEFKALIGQKQILPKNTRDPFKNMNPNQLLTELNKTKAKLKNYGKINLKALEK